MEGNVSSVLLNLFAFSYITSALGKQETKTQFFSKQPQLEHQRERESVKSGHGHDVSS